ncbi:MAG TPA: hypothetical protein VF553_19860 [Pyrinomonadaceae bacterium]|jgi:hypothetical protein
MKRRERKSDSLIRRRPLPESVELRAENYIEEVRTSLNESYPEELKTDRSFVHIAITLASIAGAVLLADMLSVKFFGDHVLSAAIGVFVAFLAMMRH